MLECYLVLKTSYPVQELFSEKNMLSHEEKVLSNTNASCIPVPKIYYTELKTCYTKPKSYIQDRKHVI